MGLALASSLNANRNNQPLIGLVRTDAFMTANDVLKQDTGMEPVSQEARPSMYAIKDSHLILGRNARGSFLINLMNAALSRVAPLKLANIFPQLSPNLWDL